MIDFSAAHRFTGVIVWVFLCERRGRVDAARETRDRLVTKLGDLKQAGEASFESSKEEIEHVWKTFKQSVNYFKSQL